LPRIEVPALVVRGERDPMVPQNWAEKAVALLPKGRLVIIPGAAHTVVYFAPKQLTQVVRSFLLDRAPDLRSST
jgi:pimeloyl-ACP methyl ester carboxylesterase